MTTALILLNSTTTNTWFLIFFPTIVLLCSLPLWFVKNLHNKFFHLLSSIAVFGFAIFLLIISSSSRDSINSPGIIGGIFIAIVIIIANAFPYILYKRKLNNNRCPNCHNLGLKILNKQIDTVTNSNTTVYSVKGGKYDGKKYEKVVDHIHKYTTYTNYCPSCNSVIMWTEESEDTMTSDERPEEVKEYPER